MKNGVVQPLGLGLQPFWSNICSTCIKRPKRSTWAMDRCQDEKENCQYPRTHCLLSSILRQLQRPSKNSQKTWVSLDDKSCWMKFTNLLSLRCTSQQSVVSEAKRLERIGPVSLRGRTQSVSQGWINVGFCSAGCLISKPGSASLLKRNVWGAALTSHTLPDIRMVSSIWPSGYRTMTFLRRREHGFPPNTPPGTLDLQRPLHFPVLTPL